MSDEFNDLEFIVNDRRYSGWKSIRVTRSIESLAGSFALEVSDRWAGQDEIWPIMEEDACRVEMGGQVVIDGYVDKRKLTLAGSLSYSGRDRAAALVDNSFLIEGGGGTASKGGKWAFRNIDVAQFVAMVAEQFGIRVSVQPDLVLKKDPLLVAHAGETGFEAIRRAVGSTGVLVVSDGKGGIVITRSGAGRAPALIQGFNVLSGEIEYDGTDRFRSYLVSSQVPGTDEAFGDATRVLAEAKDLGVKRADRVQVIRPEKGMSVADARRFADWTARMRAARAATPVIGVQGWTQPNSKELWPVNALTFVQVPRLGLDGDMLISQVDYTISEGGRVTQLHLVRPDALDPEPQSAVVSGQTPWLISAGHPGKFKEPK